MVDVEVIFMQLHVDHLLPFLVHFVFLQALVNLIHFLANFRLVFHWEKFFNLGFGSVQDLTRFSLVWRLVTQVEVYKGTSYLDRTALPGVDLQTLLYHYEGAELAQVVKQDESVF